MRTKDYGVVTDIAEGEPGSATGSLAVAAILSDSVHAPGSLVVAGSPTSSAVSLAQMCLTADQAIKLGALLSAAGADALEADRNIERLRQHGPAAARLCLALSEADTHDVLVDQSRVRIGYQPEAQRIAEAEYGEGRRDGDWRQAWRDAGVRLLNKTGRAS